MYFHYRLQFCQGFRRRKTFKWMYASQGQKNIQVGSNYNPQPNAFSFHFVFKGNFLSTIFVRWHKSEYFVQKITICINSDLLRFPLMKQPQPDGCILRQIKNWVSNQPSPIYKNHLSFNFSQFLMGNMVSLKNIKVYTTHINFIGILHDILFALGDGPFF